MNCNIDFKTVLLERNEFSQAAFVALVTAEQSFTSADLSEILLLLSRKQLTHSYFMTDVLNIVVPKTGSLTKATAHQVANRIVAESTYQTAFRNSDSTVAVWLPSNVYTKHLSQRDFQYISFSNRQASINTLYMNKRLDEDDVTIRNIILNYLSTLPESNQRTTLINHINAELKYHKKER